MKKNIKLIMFFLLMFVFALVFFLPNKEETKVKEQKKEYVSNRANELNFRQVYVKACVEETPSMLEYCECTYDYMEKIYGLERIIEMSDEIVDTGEIPDDFMKAVEFCL